MGAPRRECVAAYLDRGFGTDRLDFRPKHRLTVLVVQAAPLVEPLRLVRMLDYAGCTSWVQLPVSPAWAEPVHDDETAGRC